MCMWLKLDVQLCDCALTMSVTSHCGQSATVQLCVIVTVCKVCVLLTVCKVCKVQPCATMQVCVHCDSHWAERETCNCVQVCNCATVTVTVTCVQLMCVNVQVCNCVQLCDSDWPERDTQTFLAPLPPALS